LSKTPLVGGQWKLKGDGKYDIIVVDNQTATDIPVAGKMEPIG
jgi:branched-chain amino acid transport system substrate-binding protein